MLKADLRKKFLAKRLSQMRQEVDRKNSEIANHVLNLEEVINAQNVCIYLPVKNEVETAEIINSLVSGGKQVFFPKHAGNTRGVGFDSPGVSNYFLAPFTGWLNLEKGPFGIPQPINYSSPLSSWSGNDHDRISKRDSIASLQNDSIRMIDQADLDVAIIPGVAFDKHGVRLGYGRGVFDRLFADSKVFKIGLAYDFQIVDELPHEEHDLVMDWVVTEKRIIKI